MDGANMWNRLRRVILPIAWPGVVTAAVLCIREAWNEFAFVLALINETSMRTLPYQLYMLKDSMGVQDYAVYNAFTVLTVLPLLVVYLLLERKVVESIVSGAVKVACGRLGSPRPYQKPTLRSCSMSTPLVELTTFARGFGLLEVLHGIELAIERHAFVVLVGPSGCGKSTLLRMIAGLESVTSGTIVMDERVVNRVPAKDRGSPWCSSRMRSIPT